jgi:hypothetical protein
MRLACWTPAIHFGFMDAATPRWRQRYRGSGISFNCRGSCVRYCSLRAAKKLRLHLAFIKASLSTENSLFPTGWVISRCDLSVTVFYEKAVYLRVMMEPERGASKRSLEKR